MQKGNLTEEMMNEYTKIAYYYHKAGFTQEEIANKMSMSRQRVNRILADCITLGIVQIHVVNINESNMDVEADLEKKFNLKGACVINNLIKENIYVDLGMAAGRYVGKFIKDKDIVGFSRGRATAAMVDYMPMLRKENLTVTQLLGSVNNDREHIAVDDIVYHFAEKLQAKAAMLYAPVIVQSSELQNSITKEPYFKEAYSIMKSCNVSIVGIGTAIGQKEHLPFLNAMNETEFDREMGQQAVGEVSTHFFDKHGNPVIPSYRNRIIAISLEDYFNIPIRIGIAGLPEKADAIYGALKGGYINVLVTDLETAKLLMQKP